MALAAKYETTYAVEEVAELLHISPGGVRAMIRRGELRFVKIGRRYLIPESAIDELGFGAIKLFVDIKKPSAYVRSIRRRSEQARDGTKKTKEAFLAEIKAAE
ncbi:Helix-turn-helix domain protein [Candidatus Methylomirabilis lanthanidiphila]|uniref:Helix-turn-helix domain protein n=1 Tax=Candidatus Methylomirabilis lanthanidiphila TaxID=2211376 RepID=A0A564ZJG2_9BACT|nr:helix-turn-helix domain-containing protein [Candidatus Methylomirabilis lanthanidiphila]VUZ84782.1 Helix-turn-helix domain protein [Candidatus Methylomirabilis lanthanidiphila]